MQPGESTQEADNSAIEISSNVTEAEAQRRCEPASARGNLRPRLRYFPSRNSAGRLASAGGGLRRHSAIVRHDTSSDGNVRSTATHSRVAGRHAASVAPKIASFRYGV